MNFNSMSTIVDFCKYYTQKADKEQAAIDSAAVGYIIKSLNQQLNSRFNG